MDSRFVEYIQDWCKKRHLCGDAACDNLSCQYLGGGIGRDSWTIEFLVGEDAETESVMLNLRGLVDWDTVFAALIAELNTRLIDGPTGDIIS